MRTTRACCIWEPGWLCWTKQSREQNTCSFFHTNWRSIIETAHWRHLKQPSCHAQSPCDTSRSVAKIGLLHSWQFCCCTNINHRRVSHITQSVTGCLSYLSVFLLVAIQTVRLVLDGRVLLAGEGRVAEEAAEVIHVPVGTFCLRVLRGKDELFINGESDVCK